MHKSSHRGETGSQGLSLRAVVSVRSLSPAGFMTRKKKETNYIQKNPIKVLELH